MKKWQKIILPLEKSEKVKRKKKHDIIFRCYIVYIRLYIVTLLI